MNILLVTLLAALPFVAPSVKVKEKDGRTVVVQKSKAEVNRVYDELNAVFAERMKAFAAKDFETLVRQMSPSFTAVRPDGTTMKLDDVKRHIANFLARTKDLRSQSLEIENLMVDGDRAVADVRQNLERVQTVDGRDVVVVTGVLQTETWIRTSDGWKLAGVENEREKHTTVDGVPRP